MQSAGRLKHDPFASDQNLFTYCSVSDEVISVNLAFVLTIHATVCISSETKETKL